MHDVSAIVLLRSEERRSARRCRYAIGSVRTAKSTAVSTAKREPFGLPNRRRAPIASRGLQSLPSGYQADVIRFGPESAPSAFYQPPFEIVFARVNLVRFEPNCDLTPSAFW